MRSIQLVQLPTMRSISTSTTAYGISQQYGNTQTPYFSVTVGLYVEVEIPLASVQHGAHFIRRDISINTLFESYGIICLPMKFYEQH